MISPIQAKLTFSTLVAAVLLGFLAMRELPSFLCQVMVHTLTLD